jgi:hypothetical protein
MRASTPPNDGLTGLLVMNKDGSIHEDSIVDRVLTLRHSGRTLMEIYDPSWPISTNIVTGHTYQMILVVTNCVGLHLPILPFEGVKLGIWRGKVLQSPWYAPEDGFRVARPSLYRLHGKRRAWVLVATQIGPMLLNSFEVRRAMTFSPKVGDILQWESARFDLYAVV